LQNIFENFNFIQTNFVSFDEEFILTLLSFIFLYMCRL